MHAVLYLGKDNKEVISKLKAGHKQSNSQLINFEIKKIDQVRELTKQLKLSSEYKRTYLFEDIDDATTETMNALLKILEEPKINVSYILTAKQTGRILPTILSRVAVIKVEQNLKANFDIASELVKNSLSENLTKIDSIKKRKQAEDLLLAFIESAHAILISNKIKKYNLLSSAIKDANNCLKAIKQNGNVNLHLSKFVLLIDRMKQQHRSS